MSACGSATSTPRSVSTRPSASPRSNASRSIGFEAVYLENDGFILQLLTFAGHPAPEEPERSMVGAGLTHISLAVDDMAAAQAAVTSAGGTIIADPGGGFACMARDPEGQLIELVHNKFRPVPPAG